MRSFLRAIPCGCEIRLMEWKNGEYTMSDDRRRLDIGKVLELLSETYWAYDRVEGTVRKSIENSICFGLYNEGGQAGFARVVTDGATFAWICDLVIDNGSRGKGLGTWMVEIIIGYPDIKDIAQVLRTKDAHGLYEKFRFKDSPNFMSKNQTRCC